MLKMFAFDLDNTLLINERIRGENLLMLKRLEKSGIKLCLISGRVLSSVAYLAKEAGLSAYCVGSNGAVIADPEGNILSESYIRRDLASRLLDMGEKLDLYYHFYSADCLFSPYFRLEKYKQLLQDESSGPRRLQTNLFIGPNRELKKHMHKMMKFQFTISEAPEMGNIIVKELKKIAGISLTMSGAGLLEVMAAGIDKSTAIKTLADILNIRLENICVMGDHLNDKKMIKMAGVGVAMGNAIREVKEAADMVTASFDKSGVAKAIVKLRDRGDWIEV